MNYWASLVIGVVIVVAALLNEKWAARLTLFGFVPFCLLAAAGIIGPAAALVGPRPYMMLDEL